MHPNLGGLPRIEPPAPMRSDVPMIEKLLYRIPEVAWYLNVSRSKVYELLKSGELRSVHIDRTRLVRSCDLLAYLDAPSCGSLCRQLQQFEVDPGHVAGLQVLRCPDRPLHRQHVPVGRCREHRGPPHRRPDPNLDPHRSEPRPRLHRRPLRDLR